MTEFATPPLILGSLASELLPEALNKPFQPAVTREVAISIRDSLTIKNDAMVAFLAFATFDSDAMVKAVREMAEEDGVETALSILDVLAGIVTNFERILAIANMVEARAIIAAHVAVGEPWTQPETAEVAA